MFFSYNKCTLLKDLLGDMIDLFKYLEDLFDLEIDQINGVKIPSILFYYLDFKQCFIKLCNFPMHF